MENLTLTFAEVQSEIENINALASTVQADSDNLMEVAKRCVNSGIVTEWGQEMLSGLQKFQGTQMADSIEEIKKEAKKLESISRATATYSQGE
jgi:hypothetical protein